jgi:transglutaminase-like putative cysteine protease
MSWSIAVRHHTGLRYSGDVTDSYNEARLTPIDGGGQKVLRHELVVSPRPYMTQYVDYWGTTVQVFDLHAPHRELSITANTTVETSAFAPSALAMMTWQQLGDTRVGDEFFEYLSPSPLTAPNAELEARARDLDTHESPIDTVHAITEAIRDILRYQKGTTGVHTTAQDAFALRSGVCQDFVHVGLTMLRSRGIPARYVSGYLYPDVDANLGDTVAGESHAWLEAWVGEWLPFDPTNGSDVGERHVTVARGRDYTDVPPLKGVFHGAPGEALGVEVALTRLR